MRITAAFEDLTDLRRDLEAVADGLGRTLADGLAEDAQALLAEARALTPYGEGPRATADPDSDDGLPHIRDTLAVSTAGGSVAIYSTHPAAAVFEWGGTIAPHGAAITIAPEAMARRAAVAELPRMADAVTERINRLTSQHL